MIILPIDFSQFTVLYLEGTRCSIKYYWYFTVPCVDSMVLLVAYFYIVFTFLTTCTYSSHTSLVMCRVLKSDFRLSTQTNKILKAFSNFLKIIIFKKTLFLRVFREKPCPKDKSKQFACVPLWTQHSYLMNYFVSIHVNVCPNIIVHKQQ
jgi:hypothetical protein